MDEFKSLCNLITSNHDEVCDHAIEKIKNHVFTSRNDSSEKYDELLENRAQQQHQSSGESEQSAPPNQEWFTTNRKDCYNIKFVDDNIINAPQEYSIAHCVSRDFHCGAGIAKVLRILYGGIDILKSQNREIGQVAALPVEPERFILYMVTKEVYYGKPKLSDVERCLWALKFFCHEYGVRKLAIPLIACGLDKQPWLEIFTAKEKYSEWPSLEASTATLNQHSHREKRNSLKRRKSRNCHKPLLTPKKSVPPTSSSPIVTTPVTPASPASPVTSMDIHRQSSAPSTPQHVEQAQSSVSLESPTVTSTAGKHHNSTLTKDTMTSELSPPHASPHLVSTPDPVFAEMEMDLLQLCCCCGIENEVKFSRCDSLGIHMALYSVARGERGTRTMLRNVSTSNWNLISSVINDTLYCATTRIISQTFEPRLWLTNDVVVVRFQHSEVLVMCFRYWRNYCFSQVNLVVDDFLYRRERGRPILFQICDNDINNKNDEDQAQCCSQYCGVEQIVVFVIYGKQ
ncbi:hypothetical protein B566_EDAN011185 [Ephemera danica]|nr:hypothetical protein B566_EDAN011185 [Ephemera danica]